MPSIDCMNEPEQDELPFLLKMSNFAARAVSATSGGLPSFFEDVKYHAPPINKSARTIEICKFLFMD